MPPPFTVIFDEPVSDTAVRAGSVRHIPHNTVGSIACAAEGPAPIVTMRPAKSAPDVNIATGRIRRTERDVIYVNIRLSIT
jgi:hypothetical protein